MKITTRHATVERFQVKDENTFTIKTSARAFEILSSGIYTDPIGAVVRELSCNAYDAHVAANKKDVPFEVHLPNDLEPFFAVIDHGIGLSDTQIRGERVPILTEAENGELVQAYNDDGTPCMRCTGGLYTTYFDSTKTDSNDFIGALGLGSKSPFSYSSAFDVISRYEGTRYIYSVFLNEAGVPTVALMGETLTIEPNGLEVRLAVKQGDFSKFKERTATLLRFFPIKPKVTGQLNFEFKTEPEHMLKGSTWTIHKKQNSYVGPNYGLIAVQGNVPYRVDVDKLTGLKSHERQLLQYTNINLFFDIGQLEVAASREEIRYEPRTVENLLVAYRSAVTAVVNMINDEADKLQGSLWDAFIKLHEYENNIFTNQYISTIPPSDVKSPVLKQFISSEGVLTFSEYAGLEVVGYTRQRMSYKSKRNQVNRRLFHRRVTPSRDVVVMYNDARSVGISRVRKYAEDYNVTVMLLNPIAKDKLTNFSERPDVIPHVSYEEDLKSITKELGNVEVKLVSEATEPVERRTAEKVKEPIYKFAGMKENGGSYWNKKYVAKWDRISTTDLQPKKRLYFTLEHNSMFTPAPTPTTEPLSVAWVREKDFVDVVVRMLKFINVAHKTDYQFTDLYGASKTATRKLEKDNDWSNFFALLNEAVAILRPEVEKFLRFDKTENIFSLKDIVKDACFIRRVRQLDESSPFRVSAEKFYETASAITSSSLPWRDLYQYDLNYGLNIVTPKSDITPLITRDDFKQYPMLAFAAFAGNYDVLFDYIKLVDNAGAK